MSFLAASANLLPEPSQLGYVLLATDAPAWSTLSRAFAIQVMLADAPLVALGLVGFALGTFWACSGGMGRAELSIVLAILLAFFSAVCDLSQILIMRASNRSAAPLVIATQLLLATSNALRYAFLLLVASRCPTREAWSRKLATAALAAGAPKEVVERKELTSGFDDDEEVDEDGSASRQAGHSGEWRSWLGEVGGRVGQALAWALLVAIMVLSCVWRIGFLTSLPAARGIYTADAVLQLALSSLLALKLVATARLTARVTRCSLVGTLAELAGPDVGLALGVGVAGAGLAIASFSETPVGRFLRVADLYVLGVSHLVISYRARDVHTVSRAVLVHLAAVRACSEGLNDGSAGPSTSVPRHPSPAKRSSGGLCNWLRREVPHLLAPPSSASSGASSETTVGSPPGMFDVELGLSTRESCDFRTPRSALGRDLDMPLTAGLVGRHHHRMPSPAPVLSIRTDLDGWTPRHATPALGSNGTFRPLDTTLGVVRITNANADDLCSSPSSASSIASVTRFGNSTRLSGQRLSRPKLPQLPSVSTLRGVGSGSRTSEDDGEHLIGGGGGFPSSLGEGDSSAPPTRGSNLLLPPLMTVQHPPPAAFRPARLYAPSSLRTASVPTQSFSSEGSSPVEGEASVAQPASRDMSSIHLPRPQAVVRVSQQSTLRRSSTLASSASGQSSTGIASFYLDSFPAPPLEQTPEPSVLVSTRVSRIGLALGGADLDLRLATSTKSKGQRTDSLQPPERRKSELDRGDDVDVTSFIAGPRDSPRDSLTAFTPSRLRTSVLSVSSGIRCDSPATILQAQVLVRRPSLKVDHAPESMSAEPIALVRQPLDSSQPTPATVCAVPAIECLHRLECAIERSKGTLSHATASIPAVIIQNALQRLQSPLHDQIRPETPSRLCKEAGQSSNVSATRLVRSGSFKDRIEGRTKPTTMPAPLSAMPSRPYNKTQIPSWRGV